MTETVRSDQPWLVVSLDGAVTVAEPEVRVSAMAQAARIAPAEAHERLWESGFAAQCCRGEVTLADMIAGIRDRLGVDLTEAHLQGLWCLAYEPDLDSIAELTATSGYRLGLIADEAPLFRESFEAYVPEVEMLVDRTWLSCEHEALTDDERFYRSVAALPELGESPPTLITTIEAQAQAATAAGWRVFANLPTLLRA